MIVIGLTGSIAMGKSTAAAMLKTLNVQVHDSDASVHAIYQSDQSFIESVRTQFPEAYNKCTSRIDRTILSEIVFSDQEKKSLLEALIHPKVRLSQRIFLQKCRRLNQELVTLDIPLLFETGADQRCDCTIIVSAPSHTQKHRVLNRSGMTKEKFQAILASQMPDHEKQARADFIINSGLGRRYMFQELTSVLDKIRSAYSSKARG